MQTERVTFLTSRDHKAALDAFAASNGMSVGRVVREATSQFMAQPTTEEEAELAALVAQVNEAVPKMNKMIDDMIERMDKTHHEVDAMLRAMGARS
jgi:signal transduction protein with GAF and PtsI domain